MQMEISPILPKKKGNLRTFTRAYSHTHVLQIQSKLLHSFVHLPNKLLKLVMNQNNQERGI